MTDELVILFHGGPWERRFQVASLAATMRARGRRVTLVLFFEGLRQWVESRWDDLDPEPPLTAARIRAAGYPPLSSLLDRAHDPPLRVLGCSASAGLLELDGARLDRRLDAVVGWQTIARLIESGARVVDF